jgi:hypothetical protein
LWLCLSSYSESGILAKAFPPDESVLGELVRESWLFLVYFMSSQ